MNPQRLAILPFLLVLCACSDSSTTSEPGIVSDVASEDVASEDVELDSVTTTDTAGEPDLAPDILPDLTPACQPRCSSAECGDDGCGATCGECEDGERCSSARTCVCAPACTDNPCGDDGCGNRCGICTGDFTGTMTVTGTFNIDDTGGAFTCDGTSGFTVAADSITLSGQCTFVASGSNQTVIIDVSGAPFAYPLDNAFAGAIDVGMQVPNLSRGDSTIGRLEGTFESTSSIEAATIYPTSFDLGERPTVRAEIDSMTFTTSR